MADLKTENGHVRIANDLFEALARLHLPGNEWQALLGIIRKLDGWQKEEDVISISQVARATGLSRAAAQGAIKGLLQKNIITSQENLTGRYQENLTGVARRLRFNKDFETWRTHRHFLTGIRLPVRKTCTVGIRKTSTPPVRKTCDTTTKLKTIKNKEYPADVVRLCELFLELSPMITKKPDTWGTHWLDPMEALLRIDKKPPAEAETLIRWIRADTPDQHPGEKWPGWAGQVRSPAKFRETQKSSGFKYYEVLLAKMGEEKEKPGDRRAPSKRYREEDWG